MTLAIANAAPHFELSRVLGTVAASFGLVSALCPLLQLRRVLARRSAGDLSLTWLTVYAIGCLVWLAYGIAIDSVPLIASQALAVATIAPTLIVARRLQRHAQLPADREARISESQTCPALAPGISRVPFLNPRAVGQQALTADEQAQ